MAGQFRGSIKSWNPEKGWGFIECQQTQLAYGKDIFLRKIALLGGIERVNKGDQVEFSVTDNGKGPEAAACQCVGLQGWGMPAPMQHQLPPTQLASSPGPPGTMVGTVKSWNPVKGWGHITSDEITRMFAKDVFVMRSGVLGGELQKGQQVRFAVTTGQKGIEATNVQVLRQQAGYGGFGQMPGQPGRGGVAAAGFGAAAGAPNGKAFFGTIKVFHAEKGWGHIDCQQTRAVYSKDMFFLQSSLNGAPVEVNDYVTFSVQQGLKGPEACNIKVISSGVGGQNVGTVKQWNPEKNYGFIQCDALRAIYGRDIFLHGKETHGLHPAVGQEVSFTVEIASDGRPEAVGVSFQAAGLRAKSQPY